MIVALAQRTRPCAGETANGDIVLLRSTAEGTLLGVADALGHGPRAEVVAHAALRAFETLDPADEVGRSLERIHRALAGTRGAALTLVRIAWPSVSAVGVGNVALRTIGADLPFVSTPGIVGARMHRIRVAHATLSGRTRIIVASDGVSSRLALEGLERLDVETASDRLFAAHSKTHDDATLVVADLAMAL